MKLLIVLLGLLGLSQECWAKSSVWEVSKDGHSLLIGGTMHLLRPSDMPLPAEYDAALAQSSQVVFETDMATLENPAFAQTLADSMRYPQGDDLQTYLSPQTMSDVREFAARHHFTIEPFMAFEPGYLALILTLQGYQAQGFTIATDQRLYARAKAAHKPVKALESINTQLNALAAMNEVEPDQLIRQTLVDIDTLANDADALVSALRGGDLDTLSRFSLAMRDDYPEVYSALLVARNERWVPEIEKLINDGTPTFVLVGALHLAGPDSVLEKLKQRGYTVRYFSAS
ncbi:TraB/GumN family protein [Phytohalomonas tamaricis]|uniref:TraB/GumN family protein n=1 Tax=Phytohalomonas tamaricis TaxID=2081032 RepID=UPI000D0BC406|nr:TraB/GumN family protein [Phytohalomonas tamaricis]